MRCACAIRSRPGARRVRLLAEPLDQPDAEARFELADLQADRRLREVERARGGGEAALTHDFRQRTQLVEVEIPHSTLSQINLYQMNKNNKTGSWRGRGNATRSNPSSPNIAVISVPEPAKHT